MAEQPKPKTKFDLESVPARVYGLDDDGRKGNVLREQRRCLLLHIANYGDKDGSNIRSSVAKWAEKLEWDKHRVERRLKELVNRLKFVRNDGWYPGQDRATRLRSIDLEAIFAKMQLPSDSTGGLPSDSNFDTEPQSGLPSDSTPASLILEGGLPSDSQGLPSDSRPALPAFDQPLTSHLTSQENRAPKTGALCSLNLSPIVEEVQQNSDSSDTVDEGQPLPQEETKQKHPESIRMLEELLQLDPANLLHEKKRQYLRDGMQIGQNVVAELGVLASCFAAFTALITEHGPNFWDVVFHSPERCRELIRQTLIQLETGEKHHELKRAVESGDIATDASVERPREGPGRAAGLG